MEKTIYIIDGEHFSNLQEFYDEISEVIVPGIDWGRNLDSLDDLLCGWFDTPKEGFILTWRNSDKSRAELGYEAIAKFYEKIDQRVTQGLSFEEWFQRYEDQLRSSYISKKEDEAKFHSTVEWVYNDNKNKVLAARNQQGKTLFDFLVEIIQHYAPTVELRLE